MFTGNGWLQDHAVITRSGVIEEIVAGSSLNDDSAESFPGCFVTAAFIDLQNYGAYGKLFAVYPDTDALYRLKEYCERGGAAYCLPTVATNALDVFYKCIDAVRAYWDQGGEGILGLHIEGPWINPIKRGAHIEAFIHSPTAQEVSGLLEYGKDVIKMITLAPEGCSKEVITLIQSHGAIISAGHSNATYEEAMEAFQNGIGTVTHLYNAMSPLQHRAPGLVGATFNHENVMASIIPDGHHVDYAAIRVAIKVMEDRLFVITDAVTETDKGYYQHHLVGDKYESSGILSGSALTMVKAFQNLVNNVGVRVEAALRMCNLNPAKVIGKERELGRIEKGYSSKMIVVNEKLQLVKMIS